MYSVNLELDCINYTNVNISHEFGAEITMPFAGKNTLTPNNMSVEFYRRLNFVENKVHFILDKIRLEFFFRRTRDISLY